jgi:hypothetical protein
MSPAACSPSKQIVRAQTAPESRVQEIVDAALRPALDEFRVRRVDMVMRPRPRAGRTANSNPARRPQSNAKSDAVRR